MFLCEWLDGAFKLLVMDHLKQTYITVPDMYEWVKALPDCSGISFTMNHIIFALRFKCNQPRYMYFLAPFNIHSCCLIHVWILNLMKCLGFIWLIYYLRYCSRTIQLSLVILLLGVGIATVTDLQLNMLGSILSLLAVVTTCIAQIVSLSNNLDKILGNIINNSNLIIINWNLDVMVLPVNHGLDFCNRP